MRNIAKRAISLLCVIFLLLSMVVTVQAVETGIVVEEIRLQQTSGVETVDVPISLSNNTGILGMVLQVTYDEGLTLTKVEKGEALSSLSFTGPGDLTANPINIVWDGEAKNDTSNGVIAVLTFEVPKTIVKEYPVTISTKGVFDDNLDYVDVATKAGGIVVDYTHIHEYGDWVKVDEKNHEKTCVCGDIIEELHKWDDGQVTTAATHTTAGIKTYTCTACTAKRNEIIPADGHTVVTDEAVAPTCTETGLTEGSHCSVCDEVLIVQQVVPAKGHTSTNTPEVNPGYDTPGYAGGKHCEICDVVLTVPEVVEPTGPIVFAQINNNYVLTVSGGLSDNPIAAGITYIAVYDKSGKMLDLKNITNMNQSDFSTSVENMKDAHTVKVLRWDITNIKPLNQAVVVQVNNQ